MWLSVYTRANHHRQSQPFSKHVTQWNLPHIVSHNSFRKMFHWLWNRDFTLPLHVVDLWSITRAICGSTSLGFGSGFFPKSRHVIIYIIMIGFENLRAFHAPLLIWLPRVPVIERLSVHIASIYFIMMWLASALIITTRSHCTRRSR